MLANIIKNLKENKIDAYLINTNDEHLNEYIGPSDKRLEAISHFNGSNGLILISENENFLYTDGRYHIQAEKQLKGSPFKLVKEQKDLFEKFINFDVLGLNKKQFSNKMIETIKKKKIKIVDHDIDDLLDLPNKKFNNLMDMETVSAKMYLKSEKLHGVVKKYFSWLDYESIDFDLNVTGSLRTQKFESLREKMKDSDIFIVTALDEIAYLFNLRGNDIVYNPVFYSYAIISKDDAILFSGSQIELENVKMKDYDVFETYIENINGKNILVSETCNSYVFEKLTEKNTVQISSIIADMKSVKNNMELLGFIMAHIYDGCALTELFDFMQEKLKNNPHELTEVFITEKLIKIKEKYPGFFTPSFETISSTGPNAAIIHHTGGNTPIKSEDLYLIDSGSQFFFGTTDITRTVCFESPTQDQKKIFTDVLKAQLEAMLMNLPASYPASALDTCSRLRFWKDKEDYGHSLGHGVGHFLNVHESPPSISHGSEFLKDKMVFSIEPGMYLENKHGVRVEDLVVSVLVDKWFSFKNITLCPLQESLIDFGALTDKEITYVKTYNEKVKSIISMFEIENKEEE